MAEKKGSRKSILVLLIFIFLIVVLLFLLCYSGSLGVGNGFGTDSDNSDISGTEQNISDTPEISEHDSETESFSVTDSVSEVMTETQMLIFDITVMGSVYLYQNQEILLEDFLSEIQSKQLCFMVCITDNNATQNAMEDLLTALQDSDITYAMN